MGLTILLSADWHLDSPFASFSEEVRERLRTEQRKLPEKIGNICREENCDLVLLAGDLFDGIPSRKTLNAVKTALESWGVPVVISPGNHDFCGAGCPWLEEDFPRNVKIFTRGMEYVDIPTLDCRIYGAGYQSMDCPPLLENFRAEGERRWCVGVLHGDPTNSRSPYCPITAAQIRESGLDLLALGHIHTAGKLRAGDTLCLWPGCPMGRGWDETGEKGVCLIRLDQGAEERWIPLDTPRFYELEVDVEDAPAVRLEELLPAAGTEDFYRITLTGWREADIASLYRQFSRFPNLIFRDQTQQLSRQWEEEEDTLLGVYFRLLRNLQDTDPRGKLALDISRKLLSGGEVELP